MTEERTLGAEDLLAARFLSRDDFTTETALPAVVGGYVIEGELGRGGMGVVYAARDDDLGRDVAIKRLAGAYTPAAIERFVREGRAAARLRHPNIVSTLHAGRDDDGPYLVLELVDGESLADVLERDGPLPPERAADLIRQAAEGTAHAHAAGVLHRDIKPGNLLVRADGGVALTDFGLAKLLDDPGPTAKGEVLGSPASISPEQVRGAAVDARADVYGLGATLYALLVGRPPFVGDSVWTTLSQVAEALPDAPRRLRPETPADLEAICLRCLEKDPADRYPTAAALAEDLARFLRGAPVLAGPPARLRRLRRWASRRRAALLLAAVALLAVGVALWATRSSSDANRWAEADRLMLNAAADAAAHREPDEVARSVEAALALHPARRLRFRAARIYEALGRAARARALLEASIAAHPPGYQELMQLHEMERKVAGAGDPITPALTRLIAIADRRGDAGPVVLWARGKRALSAGDLPRAVDWLTRAIDAGVPAHLERGVARRRRGDLSGARADFERARRSDPRHPWPPFNLGVLAYQAGDLDRAQELLDQTIALRERFAPARVWRGLVRLARADSAGARIEFRFAAALPTTQPEVAAQAALQLLLLDGAPLLAPAAGCAATANLGAAPTATAVARGEVLVGKRAR